MMVRDGCMPHRLKSIAWSAMGRGDGCVHMHDSFRRRSLIWQEGGSGVESVGGMGMLGCRDGMWLW